MSFRARRRAAGGFIDMTPVVDTIFNLLIFFALSMNFLSNPGIAVDLPEAEAPEMTREERDIRIVVTPAGGVRLDGAPVTLDQLRARLRAVTAERRGAQLLIRADRRVPHGLVVAVMDAARAAGVTRMAIMTRRVAARGE